MLRKSQIITLPALIASVLLLTGCPPPAEFTQWQRASTSVDDVKAAMAECGDPVGGSLTQLPINEQVLQFQCMQLLGFKRKDGFEFCDVMKDTPACVEAKKGRPLSVSELEALPFKDDDGFYPIKPDSGRFEDMQFRAMAAVRGRPSGLPGSCISGFSACAQLPPIRLRTNVVALT
ncbi:hypothetical protein [Pseudomonas orientalis]|uniref:Lipoprotein n=1 Tax=Pseudomonas orientalis TaxID=76758 RepID=A0A8B3Y684_9PSED|nr:hypothetical protein [Pseudomonas orientalis]SDU34058.1 hypothetical protein SAMN04490197_5088 [Pseudomonas orientalis]